MNVFLNITLKNMMGDMWDKTVLFRYYNTYIGSITFTVL